MLSSCRDWRNAGTLGREREMISFIELKVEDGRKVSISYSTTNREYCHLLGNLPHHSEFARENMLDFARKVVRAFGTIEERDGKGA